MITPLKLGLSSRTAGSRYPIFKPVKPKKLALANVYFYMNAKVWEQVKSAAEEADISQGEFAEQAFRFALANLGPMVYWTRSDGTTYKARRPVDSDDKQGRNA